MEELAAKRKEKQPLEYPSAGSTFKRPEGYFAGSLIEEAGLKGFAVGGAEVSEKHAGFVINRENAAAADIYRLCCEVRDRVKKNSGVTLELEIKLLGDFTKEIQEA
jgi:UDP-N-acetylmuramate dehydrogenase